MNGQMREDEWPIQAVKELIYFFSSSPKLGYFWGKKKRILFRSLLCCKTKRKILRTSSTDTIFG